MRRKLFFCLFTAALFVAGFGAASFPAIAQLRVITIKLVGGQRITTTVASWPFAGAATRRGLAVAAVSGAPLRIISQRSLVNLRGTGTDGS